MITESRAKISKEGEYDNGAGESPTRRQPPLSPKQHERTKVGINGITRRSTAMSLAAWYNLPAEARRLTLKQFQNLLGGSGIRKNSDLFRCCLKSCDFSYGFETASRKMPQRLVTGNNHLLRKMPPMQRKHIAFFVMLSAATQSAHSAAITNLSGVYDVNTDRIAISFHIDPAPTGVDSFYFDLDKFPSPPVFDPSTLILFSSVPGAVIDQIFLQESIWIDFPTVVINPLDYSIVFQVADASAIAGPLNVDMYLNPDFGDHPSSLTAWVFADIMTMDTGAFLPGDILIPEPSAIFLILCGIFSLFGWTRR